MNERTLLDFIDRHRLAVLATVSPARLPEAAVVGFAATEDLELVFDTEASSRKAENLRGHPRIALVIGWDREITLQYEGVAEEVRGAAGARYLEAYFAKWPDGGARAALPGITHFRVRPTWVRYSDFNRSPPFIREFRFAEEPPHLMSPA